VSIRQTCRLLAAAAAAEYCSDSNCRISPQSVVFDFAALSHQITLLPAAVDSVDFVGCFGQVHQKLPRLVVYSEQTDHLVVVYSVCFGRIILHLAGTGSVGYSGPDCRKDLQSAVAGSAGYLIQVLQISCHWIAEY